MEEIIKQLKTDVREEFQIPPYFSDTALEHYLDEGCAYLLKLNPNADLAKDLEFQSLLKNYVYYAYHHKVHEYINNYQEAILSWQLSTEVPQETEVQTND